MKRVEYSTGLGSVQRGAQRRGKAPAGEMVKEPGSRAAAATAMPLPQPQKSTPVTCNIPLRCYIELVSNGEFKITVIEAMNAVTKLIIDQDVVGAQHVVLVAEKERSVLPSSTFERVLNLAVKADCLLPAYSDFCLRSYGRVAYDNIVAKAKAA